MAYIESHQELGRHPKTKRAARLLGVSRPAVVGHLNYLWWWALDFAQDGVISEYDAEEIADGALWDGEPQAFVDALVGAGFVDAVDDYLILHDWSQYTGRLMEQRRSNAKRQQSWRDRNRPSFGAVCDSNGDVTVTSALRNGATVPNPTVPDRNVPSSAERDVGVEREESLFVAAAAPERLSASPPPVSADASPVTMPATLPGVVMRPDEPEALPAQPQRRPAPKPVFGEESPPMQLAHYLAAGIRSHKPDAKIPRDLQSWAREFDLMLRVDKRPRDAITAVIDFATTNTFWRRVVFSADKVRQKFDTLDCQAHEPDRQEGRSHGSVSGGRRNSAGSSRSGGRASAGPSSGRSSAGPKKFTDEWYEQREREHRRHGLGSASATEGVQATA